MAIDGTWLAFRFGMPRSTQWIAIVLTLLAASAGVLALDQVPQNDAQRDLGAFYQLRGSQPAWVDAQGWPTSDAWGVMARLRAADEDALVPEHYQVSTLESEAHALNQRSGSSAIDAAAFDVRLTKNALRYLRDLHLGRVDPRALGFHLDHAVEPHDFAALLNSAVEGHSFDGVVADVRPPFVQYAGLKRMLKASRESDPAHARQIELAMERLRWLPDLDSQQLIVVNIPIFRVWAFEGERGNGMPILDMAAIIGRSAGGKTPVFTSRLAAVVLNPSWNVPDSIARNEILPAIDRDPNYLARNHMVMTTEDGQRRIRQLPGPWNALGQIKFEFPNVFSVYLHGTPAPALFKRERRDFSHGCIRVEDPLALAEWVLTRDGEWNRTSILSAISEGTTRTLAVAQGPRIVVFYVTAMFVPADDTVRFVDDIYGHDARLDAWLQAREIE